MTKGLLHELIVCDYDKTSEINPIFGCKVNPLYDKMDRPCPDDSKKV